MFETQKRHYLQVIFLCSIGITFLSLLLCIHVFELDFQTVSVRLEADHTVLKILHTPLMLAVLFVFGCVAAWFVFLAHKRTYIPIRSLQFNYFMAILSSVLIVYILQQVACPNTLPVSFYVSVMALSLFSVCVIIYSIYYFIAYKSKNKIHSKNFIMVGTNYSAVLLAHELEKDKISNVKLLGFVDNENYSNDKGIKIIGSFDKLNELIRDTVVDFVVIYLPVCSFYNEIINIINLSKIHGFSVHYVSNIFDTKEKKVLSNVISIFDSQELYIEPENNPNCIFKRMFDIFFASLVLIVAFPILVCAAIAIKLTSKGGVIYTQKRLGYNKRQFDLYKLRTMCSDAEKLQEDLAEMNEMDGPVFKVTNDPRITKVGFYLRKFSIDELPQLVNVLKGDMSIVGPRPFDFYAYNGMDVDWPRRRFSVRPGLTGIWQVSGRNNLTFEEWMRLDIEYIENRSFFTDLRIILMTVPEVLYGRGK